MTREERTCVAVRAHSQDQQVKHGDSVSLEGLKGKMVVSVCRVQRSHRKKLEPGFHVWVPQPQLQPPSTERVSLSKSMPITFSTEYSDHPGTSMV